MSQLHKTYFNWSSGKDSALALYKILQDDIFSIELLLCSVNAHFNRVSMHGLRRKLLEQQAKSIGIPLQTIELPESPSMEEYGEIMTKTVNELRSKHYTHAVFGDIFLEDLRVYRDNQLNPLGIKTIYPLWKIDTADLISEFLDLGFKSVIVSANGQYFDQEFVGQTITRDLIRQLPQNVDPCGENGEFHTFCYDGPVFSQPIGFEIGEKVYKTYNDPQDTNKKIGYWYCDLVPAEYRNS